MKESIIKKLMIPNIITETLLRKWERRLFVALTNEEKEKCKFKIRQLRERRK